VISKMHFHLDIFIDHSDKPVRKCLVIDVVILLINSEDQTLMTQNL
jgi:hypothetical protein